MRSGDGPHFTSAQLRNKILGTEKDASRRTMVARPRRERWQSGRMRRFAKSVWREIFTGGSNPPLSVMVGHGWTKVEVSASYDERKGPERSGPFVIFEERRSRGTPRAQHRETMGRTSASPARAYSARGSRRSTMSISLPSSVDSIATADSTAAQTAASGRSGACRHRSRRDPLRFCRRVCPCRIRGNRSLSASRSNPPRCVIG